jgi:hypothetical protein
MSDWWGGEPYHKMSGKERKRYRKYARKYNHYYGVNDAWWYPYWNQFVAPVVNPILSTFWPYPSAPVVQPGYGYPYGFPAAPVYPPIYYP